MSQSPLFVRAAMAAGVAFLLGLAATPAVIVAARRIGFVAKPRADRWSTRPTALMGGIAIFLAACLSTLIFVPDRQAVAGLGLAAALIFVVGLADDVVQMRPQYKLLAQVVAASIVLGAGIQFNLTGFAPLDWLVTFLFIVGITNAMNLLDNMDGLAAGVALVSSLVLSAAAYLLGNASAAIAGGSLAGAAMAFLVFNFYPAKIFMGDCGSMFLGLVLSVLAIQTSSSATTSVAGAVLFPSIALAIPIFDTAFVTVTRILNGRSISQGGCDHTSHRLVKLGLNERQTVLLLCGSSLLVGSMGIAAMRFEAPYLLILGLVAGAYMLVFGRFLAQVEVYEVEKIPESKKSEDAAVLQMGRYYKRQFATALIDVALVFAAFLIAWVIGAEGNKASLASPWPAVPWSVAGGAVGLGLAGVYRGVWHHMNTEDIARLVAGSLLGGLASAFGILFSGTPGFKAVGIGLIDFALLVVLLGAARGVYLAMNRLLEMARARHRGGRWLMVAPAGATAESIQGLLRKSGQRSPPLGIVLSAKKTASEFAGLPAIGSIDELDDLLARVEVSSVLIAGQDSTGIVAELCRRKGVECRSI